MAEFPQVPTLHRENIVASLAALLFECCLPKRECPEIYSDKENKMNTTNHSKEIYFQEILQDDNGDPAISTQTTLPDLTKEPNRKTILDENNKTQQKASIEFHELVLNDSHFSCLGCDSNDLEDADESESCASNSDFEDDDEYIIL